MNSNRLPGLTLRGRPLSSVRRLEMKIEGILYRFYDHTGRRSGSEWIHKDLQGSDYFIRQGLQGPELVLPLDRCGLAAVEEAMVSGMAFPERLRTGSKLASSRLKGRYRASVAGLFCILVILTSFAWQRHTSDEKSLPLVTQEASMPSVVPIGRLIGRFPTRDLWAQDQEDEGTYIKEDLTALMKSFGAEEYNIPPEFESAVDRYVRKFQGADRDLMARALVDRRELMNHMRDILRSYHIPEDLAYMALIESNLQGRVWSPKGAAGFWQFTKATARQFGMRVGRRVDDRLDLSRSTEAAGRYIRELILEFGSGSSVMLAMAAYNSGPATVHQAVRTVTDPINQRNFWYLYNTRALPDETREYVPKIMAAMVIGRNPQRFGFDARP